MTSIGLVKRSKICAIPIAKDELSSVPKRVVVIPPVVDGDGDRAATAVNRLPAELAVEQIPDLSGRVESLINCQITDRGIAIAPDNLPGSDSRVVGGVHDPRSWCQAGGGAAI